MDLGGKIKHLRTRNKMTQAELGKLLNVSHVSVSGYENGTRTPDPDTLKKIAEIFNVSADYLLDVPEKNKQNKTPDQYAQFFRVDVSDLTEAEKEEFKEEMQALSQFIAERIRMKKEQNKQ